MERWRSLLGDAAFFRTAGAGAIGRRTAAALRARAEAWMGADPADLAAALAETGRQALALQPAMATVHHAVRHATDLAARLAAEQTPGPVARRRLLAALQQYITAAGTAVAGVGRRGAALLQPGARVLVHSHSAAALAVLTTAHGQGKELRVVATAGLPLGEGRTMAAELAGAGIPVTLIPDAAAAAHLERIDLVLTGADAVLADGTLINKSGTLLLAVAAAWYRVPVYAAAESMKFFPGTDLEPPVGPAAALWPDPPAGVTVVHPLFDRTPAHLLAGFVTEGGIRAPGAGPGAATVSPPPAP